MIADASQVARDVVEWTEDWLGGFSVGDWIAIAVAGAAIYWIVVSMRTQVRLGTIEVEPLEQEDKGGAAVIELTAMLRERLAGAGLFLPPEVPAGAPKVDLASAVEASNISQAAWVAKLIELMPKPPRPPSYRLMGTVYKQDPTCDPPCRVSFRLRSTSGGRDLLATAQAASDPEAIQTVSREVYLHVIQHSLDAIPACARWDDQHAFYRYLDGLEHNGVADRLKRFKTLAKAADKQASNLIVRLKLANLMEQRADGFDPEDEHVERVTLQARALNQYLRIARLDPTLVEARYRSSVLATMLAASVAGPRDVRAEVYGALPTLHFGDVDASADADAMSKTLKQLARVETRAVLQLLRPWYTLLRLQRLRNELELRGRMRRELKRTVGISKHCRYVRNTGTNRGRDSVGVWWSHFVVRVGHLTFGGLSVGWQAHYNAACL